MQRLAEHRSYVAIVEEGSLRAAADRLNLSSSAVSKHLTQLEQHLGVLLVARSTRSLSVTDAGRRFYEDCLRLLRSLSDMEDRARADARAVVGTLRIGIPQILAQGRYLRMLVDFARAHEAIRLDVVVSNDVDSLLEQGLDFCIRVGPLADSGLVARRLEDTSSLLCGAPSLLDRTGPLRDAQSLRRARVMLPSYLNMKDLKVLLSEVDLGQDLDRFDRIDDASAYLAATVAGMGLGFFLGVTVEESIAAGRLVSVGRWGTGRTVPIHLVYERLAFESPRRIAFKEHVQDWGRALAEGSRSQLEPC